MRALYRAVLGVVLCASVAAAQEKLDTPEQAADKVIAAFRAGDQETLKALAEKDDPDPWLVAYELCFRGEHDAADAFARTAQRPDTEKLPDYVAARRLERSDPEERDLFAEVKRAREKEDWNQVLAVSQGTSEVSVTVTGCRILFERGWALRRLKRYAQSSRSFLRAAEMARELGWHRRTALCFGRCSENSIFTRDWSRAKSAAETALGIFESIDDPLYVARTLAQLGLISFRLGEHGRALDLCRRAVKIFESHGDRTAAGTALGIMGGVHLDQRNLPQAVELLTRACALQEDLRDRSITLENLATAHEGLGNHEAALESYRRAVEDLESLGWRSRAARVLREIGRLHLDLGAPPKALEAYSSSLRIAEELGDPILEALALHDLGLYHKHLADCPTAREYLSRSLEMFESFGRNHRITENARNHAIAANLDNLASVWRRLGEQKRALDLRRRALEIHEERNDRAGESNCLIAIAALLTELGACSEATKALSRAETVKESLDDRAGIARIWHARGVIHESLDEAPEALAAFERSLRLREELKDIPGVAAVLGNVGLSHRHLGDYAKALRCLERSLELHEGLSDREGVAISLLNLATLRVDLGDHAQALDLYRRSRVEFEAIGSRMGIADVLCGIGNVHGTLREARKALEAFEAAQELYRAEGNRQRAATVLSNSGVIHRKLEDHRTALGLFERAHEEFEALENRRNAVMALSNMGLAHVALKGFAEARIIESRVLALLEEVPDPGIRTNTLWAGAWMRLTQGDYADAVDFARRAVIDLGGLVSGLGELEGATARDLWTGPLDVGAAASLRATSVADLVFFLESGRGAGLREALDARGALASVLIPSELRAAETSARALEAGALFRLREASATGNRKAIIDARDGLAKARDDLAAVVERIQRTAKAGTAISHPEPAGLAEIQGCLREGEVLLLFGPACGEIAVAVVTKDTAEVRSLGAESDIVASVANLRFEDPESNPAAAVASLNEQIVDPLALEPGVHRVLISPYGWLSYFPFAFLFADREVVCVPSGTTYRLLTVERRERGHRILALGDPDYGVPFEPTALTTIRRGGRLRALPGTRAEARAVGNRVLLRGEATETGLARALEEEPRWRAVHLACHGLIDPERPLFSSLALTPDEHNDGFLTALEVFQMEIPADLVVLSACETAKGRVYRAEGVVGLTRAFMYAGAPCVLCSLWKVDDEATKALMVKFYELWNPKDGSQGLPTATALKRAQEYVAGHAKWKHPYYWAAWQLWGLPD